MIGEGGSINETLLLFLIFWNPAYPFFGSYIKHTMSVICPIAFLSTPQSNPNQGTLQPMSPGSSFLLPVQTPRVYVHHPSCVAGSIIQENHGNCNAERLTSANVEDSTLGIPRVSTSCSDVIGPIDLPYKPLQSSTHQTTHSLQGFCLNDVLPLLCPAIREQV